LVRACVYGLGLGAVWLGLGTAGDIPIAIVIFAIPGVAMMAAGLFLRGPSAVGQKIFVALMGLVLSLPLVLLVILILLAIDSLIG
jgi:hypothetical protein